MSSLTDNAGSPTTSAVFKLAWPLTLKAIMLHGIVVIDAYLVSALGEEALAAMGLATSIAGLLMGIIMAFSTATQIRVAQAFGSDDPVALKTGLYCGLLINLAACCLGLLLVWLGASHVIHAFAHTPQIAELALSYLQVFAVVILVEAMAQCLTGHFNGCGETKIPFYSYLIAVPANIIMSIVLIYGLYGFPELGLVGAAVGSAMSSTLRLLYLSVRLYRRDKFFLNVEGWLRGTLAFSTKRHLIFALPIAGTFISSTLASSVAMLLYAKLNVNQFAAMTLIMPWVMVAGTFGITWAQATGIFVAQLLGRKSESHVLDEFLGRAWRAAFIAAILVATTYVLVCLSSTWLYEGLKVETTTTLLSFLPVLLFLPFPKISNAICGNTLRAGGDTLYVMYIFVGSQWLFRLPLTAFMVLYLDLSAIWVFALVLGEELVKFPAFHLRLFKGEWKRGIDAGA
ncbi:MAG: MATE family efflux transporter [Litoreibacter sp.]|uniref:MATE family efflux transporter n=1 Tax=Litoreibacter sp. TaxID=1969459 RepID=UPI00329913B0